MQDKRLFFIINKAQRLIQKWADAELMEQLGISSAQMGALFFLEEKNGCLLKELSDGLMLNNSAITGLAGRMEKSGLIEKRDCQKDGRAFRVYLTEKGRTKVRLGIPMVEGFNQMMKRIFTAEEIDFAIGFFNRIIAVAAERKIKP